MDLNEPDPDTYVLNVNNVYVADYVNIRRADYDDLAGAINDLHDNDSITNANHVYVAARRLINNHNKRQIRWSSDDELG